MTFNRDIFSPDVSFELEEASSEVDGKHIIGKIRGVFFLPDGISRNNRYYPRDLWERVVSSEDIQSRLKNRRMFGTIGHEQPINDEAIREGKISHIITNLKIDDSGDKVRGIGEALILDTPAGRSLNTLLRAGSKMFVSSRAFGKYNGLHKGIPKVDSESYKFETFDFVMDPGFAEANPSLIESLEIKPYEGDRKMEKELFEKVVMENTNLKSDLNKALGEIAGLKDKEKELKNDKTTLEQKVAELEKKVKDLEVKLDSANQVVGAYKEIGSPKEIKDVLVTSEGLLNNYKELGSPEEINKALDEAKSMLTEYRVLGSPKEINEAIEKSIDIIKKYKEIGEPDEISMALEESYNLIKEYKEFGSIEELRESFDKMTKVISNFKNEIREKKIKELATELQVSEDNISKVYDKLSEGEIRELFKKVTESTKIKDKYEMKGAVNESKNTETSSKKSPLYESRINRLISSFN